MEFEKYLKTNNLVHENKIKYFSNWADKFLHGLNYKVSAIDQNSIISFINSMRKDQRYEDWQIRQAESALRIYVRNFLNLNTQPAIQEKPAEQKNRSALSWQEAILKIKECMRIRHYSYSTEKTYIEWIERFQNYLGKNNVNDVQDDDVRKFMAYLAVNQRVSASTQNQAFCAILFLFRYVLEKDISLGHGEVHMPEALDRKYPNASKELGWQWFFPSKNLSVDPRSGKVMRHHVLDGAFQKKIKKAIEKACVNKHGSCHAFRHAFAAHLLENGTDIKVIQELLGHNSLETTMIYTHVAQKKLAVVESPLDRLGR